MPFLVIYAMSSCIRLIMEACILLMNEISLNDYFCVFLSLLDFVILFFQHIFQDMFKV